MNLNRNVLPIAIGLAASGAVNADDINAWGPWESAVGGGGGSLLNQLLAGSFGFTSTATNANTDDSSSGQSFINTLTATDPITNTTTPGTTSLSGFSFTGYWAKAAAINNCESPCSYINHSGLFGQAGFNVVMGEGSAGSVNGVFLLGSGSQAVTSNNFLGIEGSAAPGGFYFTSKGLNLDGSALAGRTIGYIITRTPGVRGSGAVAGAGQVYSTEYSNFKGFKTYFTDDSINSVTHASGALGFFTGETTPAAAMTALQQGSFTGYYSGSSAIYNQCVSMCVSFGPGTWTGVWIYGNHNVPNFNAAGTISGATISGAPTTLIAPCGTISGSIVGNFINTGCGTNAGGIIGATCITAPSCVSGSAGPVGTFVDVFRVTGTPSSPEI